MVFERIRRVERNPREKMIRYAAKRLGKSEKEVEQMWKAIKEERDWDDANTKALFQHTGIRFKMHGARKEEIERILKALKERGLPTADQLMLAAHAIEQHREILKALPKTDIKIDPRKITPEIVAEAMAEHYMERIGGGTDEIAKNIVKNAKMDVNTMHKIILEMKASKKERLMMYRKILEMLREQKQ